MDKHIFLTGDKYETSENRTEVDENILKAANTGEGMIPITPDMLRQMAIDAKAKFEKYKNHVLQIMNKARAQEVYDLRVKQKSTWRAVALACWAQWKEADWHPATNQIAGIALCQRAAEILKINIE